jgi:hypothetical protein
MSNRGTGIPDIEPMIGRFNFHQVKGQCSVCKRINHTSIWAVSQEVSIFRGEDKSIGKFCKECKKGRFRAMSKPTASGKGEGK